ncbi:hypothetical protein [Pseudooceanicola algae]|uniref:Uncharacterized protein n=1 Tax=Pseudooceanicola algae TaxID=1537215 RepID=A0A418SCD7_9RHOB|nr:hypothetical protein [Pseudooceanicola algae]QPM90075.1 hypothetical protein PSAL_013090 [Pseudooceanicola algae]
MADKPLHGMGHNLGPSMDPGHAWRVHQWTKARQQHSEAHLPVELVRLRIARARELGLRYRDYAAIRAVSGRDIAGYLISSNALGVYAHHTAPQEGTVERLEGLRHVRRIGLALPPLRPEALLDGVAGLDAVFAAPPLLGAFPRMRDALARAGCGLPPAGLVLISGHALERDWVAAGRLGGALGAEALFPASAC